ncbi:MAG: VWA-like domain-containing protein [Clostridiales bacterium]|nr:VWA-like domain-containing protein [Clostridiales bacterium]
MEEDRAKKIAAEVLESCRNQTYFQLRYLEHAIFYLRLEERENTTAGSDGRKFYYGVDHLLHRYLQSPDAVNCDFLHTVFHCLYQHPLQAKAYDRRYWDLAADIAVTDVLTELLLPQMICEIPAQCLAVIGRLKQKVPLMSAPHIARYLMMEEKSIEKNFGLRYEKLQELFARDEHTFWKYREMPDKESPQKTSKIQKQQNTNKPRKTQSSQKAQTKQEPQGQQVPQEMQKQQEQQTLQNMQELQGKKNSQEQQAQQTRQILQTPQTPQTLSDERLEDEYLEEIKEIGNAAESMSSGAEADDQLREDWSEIAENVMLSAQSFAKTQGDLPGCMVQTLQRLTRETYDYTDFLKKFAVLEESMKLNQDEFDYLYYLYGLNQLGRIALIEPLEYKEEYLIRDFVIAIDTSGSCSGELVQRFLNKTYNILKSTESFTRKVVIHVIQCDCVIQDDTVIESLDDLESYTKNLELKGLGGTDFRPVFAYVDELCTNHEFRDLRGLIYFTDGYGIFPGQPPKYKTAFVFLNREDQVRVPPWAMRMYLDGADV